MLTHPGVMTGTSLYHNRRGRPCYYPHGHHFPVSTGHLQPRRFRPGHILIKSVAEELGRRSGTTDPRKRTSAKLAISRDHAKRFLRSVIHNTPSTQPSVPEPTVPSVTTERRGSIAESHQAQRPGSADEMQMRAGMRGSIGGPVSGMVSRPSLADSVRNANDATTRSTRSGSVSTSMTTGGLPGVDPIEKPLASSNGVSVSINLAEPVLFLQGFEPNDMSSGNTAMLRGTLHLRVTKSAKIKAVTLKFRGRAVTKWPEGEHMLIACLPSICLTHCEKAYPRARMSLKKQTTS